jgi:PhzF family phenazine biosynthesis protein
MIPTEPNIEMKKQHNHITVHIINAFTDNNTGGNPAGVVLNADNLSNADKLAIAGKAGLSETAFVSRSETAAFKLDFFTPVRQIAHCGHATIAVFSHLKQSGLIEDVRSSKETIDGNRNILYKGEAAFMEQKAPRFTDIPDHSQSILDALGLTDEDLIPGRSVSIVNTGNSFMIVPVRNTEILRNISPDLDTIHHISEIFDLIGFYVFTTETAQQGRDANARMFAPRYGITEESATGMAAGPLACYLYKELNIRKDHFLIEQGWLMPEASPSLIIVDLDVQHGEITGLMAGGKGNLSATTIIDIPFQQTGM